MHIEFKHFYRLFFDELKKNSLKYCVVRNYKGLPNSKPGGDVDVLIKHNDIYMVFQIIESILKPIDGKIEITSRHQYVLKLKLHNVVDDHTNKPVTELDLIINLNWKGMCWLSANDVLNQSSINSNNIYIPKAHHELQMSLFHSLLYGGFVKDRYSKNMASLFLLCDKSLLKKDLYANFGPDMGKMIYIDIEKSTWQGLKKKIKRIRLELIKINFCRNCVFSFLAAYKHFYLEILVRSKLFWIKNIRICK